MIPFKLRSRNGMVCLWILFAVIGVGLVLFASHPTTAVVKESKGAEIAHTLTTDFEKLQAENSALRDQVRSLESLYLAIKQRVKDPEEKHPEAQECDIQKHVHKKFVPQGMREVLDWESFDPGHVYSWRRTWQVMGHLGNSRLELQQVVQQGLQQLGAVSDLYKWAHGNVRVDQLRGVEYMLDFALKDPIHNASLPRFRRVNFLRPVMQVLVQETDPAPLSAQTDTLYIILPLSGRPTMFQSFLKGLAAAVPKKAPPVHVVVVYFAEDTPEDESNRASVEQLLEFYQHNHGFGFTIKVLMQPFSRGVGLETGAYAAAGDNPHALLFFCDVDMKFNADFLYRCRANPVESQRVYFPIVFSLYRNKPSTVSAPNGAWRNYGLGMVCLYKSDFKALGGFSKTITGWGREDVDFYDRTVKQGLVEVVRAVDDGIFHMFHEKICDESSLTEEQFKDCIGSMADWEGTKVELGKIIAGYRLKISRMEAASKEQQKVAKAAAEIHD